MGDVGGGGEMEMSSVGEVEGGGAMELSGGGEVGGRGEGEMEMIGGDVSEISGGVGG